VDNDVDETADKEEGKKKKPMDFGVAQIILAGCKPVRINAEFDNPEYDTPCTCLTCRVQPPPSPKENCDCSGCVPEVKAKRTQPSKRNKAPSSTPTMKPLTTKMRSIGTEHLKLFRYQIWDNETNTKNYFLPPDAFCQTTLSKPFSIIFHHFAPLIPSLL
jgi:hypothetical protein